jgi:hypothetical protein
VVQEAGDEAVVGVVDVYADGLDVVVLVGGVFEAGEVWRVGEARVFVD